MQLAPCRPQGVRATCQWDGGQLIPNRQGGWQPVGPVRPCRTRRTRRRRWRSMPQGLQRIRDAFVQCREARRAARHRRHRGAQRARLSPASVPVADLQQAHRPVWRQPAEPHALSARSVRRGARGVSDDKPVGVKVSATDWVEGGWDIEQTIEYAQELKKRGVDWIDASSGGVSPLQKIPLGPGYQVPLAQAIKQATGVTTMAVGLITEAQAGRGDRGLRQGRHGRARPRHALRPALGLARRGRTRRPGRCPAAILALAALDAEGAVRRDDVRDAVTALPSFSPSSWPVQQGAKRRWLHIRGLETLTRLFASGGRATSMPRVKPGMTPENAPRSKPSFRRKPGMVLACARDATAKSRQTTGKRNTHGTRIFRDALASAGVRAERGPRLGPAGAAVAG